MTTNNPVTGYPEAEYLLVIQPHADLYDKIMTCKNEFAEKYNAAAAAFGKPHITLLRFKQVLMAEEKITRYIGAIASGCPPMKIELNNFGSFPSHTIYLNIVGKQAIRYMVRELKSVQRLVKGSEKPHFITEPHLTIARRLQPQQYEQAWKEYQHLPFSWLFIADHLLLLKRAPGMRSYEQAASFQLLNKSTAATQGALFL